METKVETTELSEKDIDINLFFTRLPPAKILKKISQETKFWKPGSNYSPTIQDVKRIIVSHILDESLKQKTFITIKIATKFGTETVKWLQNQGYTVVKTEKTSIDGLPAFWYSISWESPDEQEEPDKKE
jgi:hypothetical protein